MVGYGTSTGADLNEISALHAKIAQLEAELGRSAGLAEA
jgi:hypothetical protein